jgi:uncharacterized membrane protein YbhN (UPF0104 family)
MTQTGSAGAGRRAWLALQAAALALMLWFAGRYLVAQWDDLRATARDLKVGWGWVAAASAVVLATYAALIQAWRMLLAGWGSHLPYGSAVRIWTIANLGRWLPGRVWSIGAMGVLSQRAGVSGVAAAGASVLGTLLNIGAGFGILALTGTRILDKLGPGMRIGALAGSVLFATGVLLLPRLLPAVLRAYARWKGGLPIERHLPARTLWLATAVNAASWLAYGTAFALFARGVLPALEGSLTLYVALFAAPYLTGFLFILAPGGLGARELSLVALAVAAGLASTAEATLLALTSRVWLTFLEILPGVVSLALTPVAARRTLPRR